MSRVCHCNDGTYALCKVHTLTRMDIRGAVEEYEKEKTPDAFSIITFCRTGETKSALCMYVSVYVYSMYL